MSDQPPIKPPKERTVVAFFLGAFLGRYGIPLVERCVYIGIIFSVVLGKPLFLMPQPIVNNIVPKTYDECLTMIPPRAAPTPFLQCSTCKK